MGRIRIEDVDKYGNDGGGSFFSLKNDKDTAQVRIMIDKPEDISDYIFACHEVKIGDSTRYVNCLREYNDPLDVCPFCLDRRKQKVKVYIPLYNVDSNEVQIWDRGKNFLSKLTSQCNRYGNKGSVVSNIFEIERNGKAGDMKTTYEMYQIENDDTRLEDLPEVPEILGGILMDKTSEDMNYYLDEGEFPPTDKENIEEDSNIRRRESRSRNNSEEVSERPERRTPANSRRR